MRGILDQLDATDLIELRDEIDARLGLANPSRVSGPPALQSQPNCGSSPLLSDDRDVLVRIKATPEGLRNLASLLEQREIGQSVRVNWYTVQVEFVRVDHNCAVC